MFRCLPEVEIQQKIAFWKAESLRNSVSKESEPKDASIESNSDFESDHFVVRRLRRRAFGVKIHKFSRLYRFDASKAQCTYYKKNKAYLGTDFVIQGFSSWVQIRFLGTDFVIRPPTAERSDSKSLYLAIDASSGANSFETEKLRLSAFQNAVFCWILTSGRPLNSDFESRPQIGVWSKTSVKSAPSAVIYQNL